MMRLTAKLHLRRPVIRLLAAAAPGLGAGAAQVRVTRLAAVVARLAVARSLVNRSLRRRKGIRAPLRSGTGLTSTRPNRSGSTAKVSST